MRQLVRHHTDHLALLERWLRSYRPDELFDGEGRLRPEIAELAPAGNRRMSANPHANGGALLRDLSLPEGSLVVLIVRGGGVVVPRGDTQLEPGDEVCAFVTPEARSLLDLLFGAGGDEGA